MDLSQFEWSETYDYTVKHPITGADTDAVITLWSMDTDEYQKAIRLYLSDVSSGKNPADCMPKMLSMAIKDWENIEHSG
jgi:hypothetical protein